MGEIAGMGGFNGKQSACNVETRGSIPGSGRSLGEGNGYPLQYSKPVEILGQRSSVGYKSMELQRVGHTE